eukprot:1468526-Pleurochrysis_carterae.AAC.1
MGSDIVTASDGSPFAWGPGNTWRESFNGGTFNDETLWTRTNDPELKYIQDDGRDFLIYTKVVPPGNYTIDNNSGAYLFADAH